jgi:hypothetical protein
MDFNIHSGLLGRYVTEEKAACGLNLCANSSGAPDAFVPAGPCHGLATSSAAPADQDVCRSMNPASLQLKIQ